MYWDTLDQVSGSNFTNTSTTLTDITGLSRALVANSTYEVDVMLRLQSTDSGGQNLAMQYSVAGAFISMMLIGMTNSSNITTPGGFNAFNTASGLTVATSINVDRFAWLKGIVVIGANAGNLTVQTKQNSAGTGTVYIGSILKLRKLA